MANPTSISLADYQALQIDSLNNMSITSSLVGSTLYFGGRVRGTNKIAFIADVQGTPSLTESSTRNLSLSGVDLSKSSARSYYTYDIGIDPVQNIWEVVITGSAGNQGKFKKSGMGGGNPNA